MFGVKFLKNNKFLYIIVLILLILGTVLMFNLGIFCGGKGSIAYYYIVDAIILFTLSGACLLFSIDAFMRFSEWLWTVNKGIFWAFISLALIGMLHFIVYFACQCSPNGGAIRLQEAMVIFGIIYSVVTGIAVGSFISEDETNDYEY
jgi:hypothetical protein